MPIPVYLVCAESHSTDATTKLISLFKLIEKLQIFKAGTLPGLAAAFRPPITISACWMKEDTDDPETPFEVQFVGIFPGDPAEFEIARGEFRFVDPLQRVNAGVRLTRVLGPGILRIEARIRRVGEQECISRMSYPIILEEIQPPPGIVATDPAQPLPGD